MQFILCWEMSWPEVCHAEQTMSTHNNWICQIAIWIHGPHHVVVYWHLHLLDNTLILNVIKAEVQRALILSNHCFTFFLNNLRVLNMFLSFFLIKRSWLFPVCRRNNVGCTSSDCRALASILTIVILSEDHQAKTGIFGVHRLCSTSRCGWREFGKNQIFNIL